MAQLHLIQTQLEFTNFRSNYQRFVSDKDSLLFLNEGLVNLLSKDYLSESFIQITSSNELFALDEQLTAQAINISGTVGQIQAIDYQKFIALCQSTSKVVAW